ncbi:uncharacterized protein TNCT_715371 [Trichonephila clavata]|uniref:Uncharacterized protein n=1 Tax=Trichonephila clavata TaxID=2740835 RepID=A0A8X6J6H5_TRICU|nr:uncharacterized protein TNCT_715371 [Trichonephila clavata]
MHLVQLLKQFKGLEINELNYDSAVELLKKRFGNKEVIINNHMNKLLNLLPVYKSNDIPKLKKLHSEIEVNVRSLSALGLEPKSYSSMLIAVVLKIIPTEFTLEYNRRNVDKKFSPDINDFLEFFQAEIESRERTYLMKPEFDATSLYTNSKKNKSKPLNKVQGRTSTCEFMTSKFWDLEVSGLIDTKQESDVSENQIIKNFESNIKYDEKSKRYRVKLPWKLEARELKDNREIAKRYTRLRKRFQKNPHLFLEYREVLQNYLKQGIIELVPDSDSDSNNVTFYLPHREVIRKDSPSSQLRIVYDASSHDANSPSLNSCLHIGPNLYPEIFDILLRFRLNAVAFTADMNQAFLQILLNEEDRDVTKFLFSNDPFDESQPPSVYRFTRVLFGTRSQPLVNQALTITLEAIKIFEDASIPLHKWQTNSKSLHKAWQDNGVVSDENSLATFEKDNLPYKVLGIAWNSREDFLYFDIKGLIDFVSKRIDTKIFILQVLGRIFDPIGFLGPFTLRVKHLMQKVWFLGLDWDESLPDDIISLWAEWCEEVPQLTSFSIPRCYFSHPLMNNFETLELHLFSDASTKAYGTVAFISV